MMHRRDFLGAIGIGATALVGRRRARAEAVGRLETIGLQLYTVRELLKSDFEGTLARVAEVGYREVEFAGYFGRAPEEVRAVLDRNRLKATSTHVEYDTLGDGFPRTLEIASVVGHAFVVCPSIPDALRAEPDGWKKAAETFNRVGEASRKAGIRFAYHNHHIELAPVDGKRPYDVLLAETDAALVEMEMDLCWTTVGGADPLAYFQQYPGRFPLVHVKDLTSIPTPAPSEAYVPFPRAISLMTDVGQGVIDWKKIFARSNQAGIEHTFVEHDQPKDPLACIRNSYRYLESLRF
jgi:sugar phosphate isomerase/epimerase